MTTTAEVMSAGMQARLAEMLVQDVAATGLTGAGTSSQATALALISKFAIFSTVAANSGAILGARGIYVIVNNGANPLLVYPPVGGNINGATVNTSFSLTNGKAAIFISNGLTWGAILSA